MTATTLEQGYVTRQDVLMWRAEQLVAAGYKGSDVLRLAERSDIDQIVDLGSSLSEDWKLILKASYKVTGAGMQEFYKAVIELQYRHVIYDLMLGITGDLESYSFSGK